MPNSQTFVALQGQTFLADLDAWRNHIIICGVNNLSLRILEQLEATGIPVIFIDDEPEEKVARILENAGYSIIREDSRAPQVLEKARIRQAFALIAVANSDLDNLETILEANELRPGLRTVGNFFNEKLGRQLAVNVANARVVSLSEKASPSFVTAALPNRVLDIFQFSAGAIKENIVVAEVTVETSGTIQTLFGSLTVPALNVLESATNDSAEPLDFPGDPNQKRTYKFIPSPPETTPVKPGDQVMVVARTHELKSHPHVQLRLSEILQAEQTLKTDKDSTVAMRPRKVNPFIRIRNLGSRIWRQMGNSIRFALIGVFSIMTIGTVVFRYFYRHYDILTGQISDLDWLTALYFTVTIMSTTGFGDFNLAYQASWLKIFGIFMMFTGAATVAVLYAFLTNFLISLRLDEELGRSKANEMQDHIIMCGLGTVGYRTLKGLLRRGQQVVVIEPKEEARFNAEVQALGVPIIKGDARSPEIMKAVNLDKAKCLVIMTSTDLTNLEIALTARDLRPDIRVVLRLFDRKLAAKVENSFNIHTARSASALAAPAFVAEIFNYEQINSFYVESVPFTIAKETVLDVGELAGLTVGDLEQRTGVTVLVHYSNGQANFHPVSQLLLTPGDVLVQVGPYDSVIRAHLLNSAIN